MGKSMARIQNGVVTNIEWVSDDTVESDTLKEMYGLHIRIGDTYSKCRFYRDSNRILSFREQVHNMVTDYDTALTEIESNIPSTMALNEHQNTTIEERKQHILSYLTALLEVTTEGGAG